jgi:hypothetical protein
VVNSRLRPNRSATCQPDADSLVMVTWPSNFPAGVHRLPTWVPVLPVPL